MRSNALEELVNGFPYPDQPADLVGVTAVEADAYSHPFGVAARNALSISSP